MQNRVTPFGDIIATPERGTFMSNRGVLHDAEGHIKRTWESKRWIVCLLEFRGRKQQVMTPGQYTELFFLDEATWQGIRLRLRVLLCLATGARLSLPYCNNSSLALSC
jgi:hypothetical protein